ncbi:atrial natriuretic peptide receptor 1-like [Paramacrobiotus metropolitanus]|uniref:atrial natriuretic peptide receptor 1-like n=1 Tax=Paramacrobiotus metropolitanus TaxID=2943436 RepID=UPI002445D1EE|nr:atrial natriuretic peptide receptor 1-like [Paramacrobiotus metropolitanus]
MLNLTRSLFFVTFRQSSGHSRQLNSEISDLARIQYNKSYDEFMPLDVYSVKATYDAVELFVRLAVDSNTTSANGYSCGGLDLFNKAVNRSFDLTSGRVIIDHKGNSLLDADILVYESRTRTMQPYAFYSAEADTMVVSTTFPIDWPAGSIPLDVPLCGFEGTGCDTQFAWKLPVYIAVPVTLVFLVFVATFMVRQHRRYQASAGCWWLIDAVDVVKMDAQNTNTHLAVWESKPVWKRSFAVKKRVFVETLGKIQRVSHANVNTLCGIVISTDSIHVCYDYCKRGSLSDLLSRMKLDLDFQVSLIHDLLKGCAYLAKHSHPHGFLHPECCLIDDRFTLRIGDFDFQQIKQRGLGRDWSAKDLTKSQECYAAPDYLEALRQGKRSATAPADVYSVGRLMQLITSPEHSDAVKPVQYAVNWQSLVDKCINPSANLRPSIYDVEKQFNSSSHGRRKKNIVDAILARFENYAAELEIAVKIKTDELMVERNKCDELLREMLPRFIVDNLRNQIRTEPTYFESVTVFFSEIDGFSAWLPTVQPEVVMKTLSSIYFLFDQEIPRFDVYKVETIKDSYMVVGGIPAKEYLNHGSEVCEMALAFVSCFSAAKMPSQFALQCGIHSGPCAAGVMGRRVPRYCLFGDTVNTASRMNSHSQAGKVHLSPTCRALIADIKSFRVEERGTIPVKGKGMMTTYWLLPFF